MCRCGVVIEIFLLANYRFCRCSVVVKKLLLSNHRLRSVAHWLKCYCLQVIASWISLFLAIKSLLEKWTQFHDVHFTFTFSPTTFSLILSLESAKSRGLRGNVGCVDAWIRVSEGCVDQIFTWVAWFTWVKIFIGLTFYVGHNFYVGCVVLWLGQKFLRRSKIFPWVKIYLLDEIILLYYN